MKQITTLLVLCVLALLAFGLVMLYSVSPLQDSLRFVSRQMVAGAIGLVAGSLMAMTDYRRLKSWSWVLGVAAILMLILVLVPGIGYKANGARRWFRLAGIQFQPSDFAKVALLVGLAHYGAHYQRLMQSFRRGILIPGVGLGAALGLIFLEPDWGTALLLAVVGTVMLLLAGVRWRHVLPPLLGAALLVGGMLALNPVRSDRIYSWLHLEETKDGIGYQVWQARLGLAQGGATGVGLDRSTQKRFVPEHRTDFIYAIIAEEFGFAGALAVLVAFFAVAVCGLVIASRAPDTFGLLLGSGISFLIGLQALLNMAVVSGALPNKGLALPFISYGGSNLMIMLFCVGLLVSIGRMAAAPANLGTASLHIPSLPITRLA